MENEIEREIERERGREREGERERARGGESPYGISHGWLKYFSLGRIVHRCDSPGSNSAITSRII